MSRQLHSSSSSSRSTSRHRSRSGSLRRGSRGSVALAEARIVVLKTTVDLLLPLHGCC